MGQIPLSSSASADYPQHDEQRSDKTREIAADVAYRQIAIVKSTSSSSGELVQVTVTGF
jgi:hypothetical protein